MLHIFCALTLTFDLSFAGQVGYVIAGMKEVKDAQIGDTFYIQNQPVEALPGFKPAKCMVFAGIQLSFKSICNGVYFYNSVQ